MRIGSFYWHARRERLWLRLRDGTVRVHAASLRLCVRISKRKMSLIEGSGQV